MTFSVQGTAVARGIAIGRAVVVGSGRADVAHYFIQPAQVEGEIERVRVGRNAVIDEIHRLQQTIAAMGPKEAPHELSALLDVHLMLLQDEELISGVKHWITERLYNAEWALTTQLEVLSRQFDDMEDDYLRERKADLEQVAERILRYMKGMGSPVAQPPVPRRKTSQDMLLDDSVDVPLVLVAHDLSPADMLQFKQSVFTGFVTDVGGKTSHTAIVARSLDIPAVVGARSASNLVRQDDWVIVDGESGVLFVDPSPIILAEYGFKQRQGELERGRLNRLRHTPAVTLDGEKVELLANIEQPEDAAAAGSKPAPSAWACSAASSCSWAGWATLPGRGGAVTEAYRKAVEGMQGLLVTIRTIDVGADKPLDDSRRDAAHLNPALGLRAIRWSLAEPEMFRTQLRAILRAAAHGRVNLLVPMLAHGTEIRQTLSLIDFARAELDNRGTPYGPVPIGAMIEVPAAALQVRTFLKYFDFLSIGTNDLIQYTLAIDRADESVAHLYDPCNPAVLQLVGDTIAECRRQGKPVSVCGEMAGDTQFYALRCSGLGLRSFSMHPAQILAVKQEVLRADATRLAPWAHAALESEDPGRLWRP